MPAILDIPEVRERVSRLSIDEYHQLAERNDRGRRTELIRGILIEKIYKSPVHVFFANRLRLLLENALPKGHVVRVESPLTFADSEPEPDLAVVKGAPNDFRLRHPNTAELVIEIAVSSAALDRQNAGLYAEAGVKEYWIVLAASRQIESYRNVVNGQYSEMDTLSSLIQSASFSGIHLNIPDLFA